MQYGYLMKILVAVKRVIDPYVKIRVKQDGSGVETANVKTAMNPFDEIALEEAIRLKEQNRAAEVVVVSVGDISCQETLRHGLALGADRAIHVQTINPLCSIQIAKILQVIVLKEEPGLVLMGKQSIDGDNNQTPQMLAGLLDWPQATYASKIIFDASGSIIVSRETDTGLETIMSPLPMVVSVDLRLNAPRYASLPNIMKAKQKPLSVIDLETLGIELKVHQQILSVSSPPVRQRGEWVQSMAELVDKLQKVEKII